MPARPCRCMTPLHRPLESHRVTESRIPSPESRALVSSRLDEMKKSRVSFLFLSFFFSRDHVCAYASGDGVIHVHVRMDRRRPSSSSNARSPLSFLLWVPSSHFPVSSVPQARIGTSPPFFDFLFPFFSSFFYKSIFVQARKRGIGLEGYCSFCNWTFGGVPRS